MSFGMEQNKYSTVILETKPHTQPNDDTLANDKRTHRLFLHVHPAAAGRCMVGRIAPSGWGGGWLVLQWLFVCAALYRYGGGGSKRRGTADAYACTILASEGDDME